MSVYEEAALILDPESTNSALRPYAYDPKRRTKVVQDACKLAADVLREYDRSHEQYSWVKVEDDMPKEHDSMFVKYKGTDEWKPYMFSTISPMVLVTVKRRDGTKYTTIGRTIDGKWSDHSIMDCGRITHWCSMPAPAQD